MCKITAGAVHAVRKLANKKNLVISTKFSLKIIFFWVEECIMALRQSEQKELNPRHAGYKPAALPLSYVP